MRKPEPGSPNHPGANKLSLKMVSAYDATIINSIWGSFHPFHVTFAAHIEDKTFQMIFAVVIFRATERPTSLSI